MAEQPKAPVLIKPIPPLVTNEGAAFGPFDLKDYVKSPPDSGVLRFSAELHDGGALPRGLICTQSGLLSGIAAKETAGSYDILLTVENDSGMPFLAQFNLTIRERVLLDDPNLLSDLKSQVWEALGKNLPIPELGELLNRPISAVEIYYLLQRFAVLTIWDIYNLETPSDKVLLTVEGNSPHYNIYDRGSCLVAAPKELFSHQRTLGDALQAARALAGVAYERGWTIEFAGFNKMVRAAWIELQLLGDQHGKKLEILHYNPSVEDIKLYAAQTMIKRPGPQ